MSSSNFMQKAIRDIDNAEHIRQLLENNSETQRHINEKDEHGDTLLHFASMIHNTDFITAKDGLVIEQDVKFQKVLKRLLNQSWMRATIKKNIVRNKVNHSS